MRLSGGKYPGWLGSQISHIRQGGVQPLVFACTVALLAPSFALAEGVNLTTGKSITATGHYHGDISTLVDGAFVSAGTDWRSAGNTVWWTGDYNAGVSYTINLGGTYTITGLVVQADDNDSYRLSYWNSQSSSWTTAWDLPVLNSGGLETRPVSTNNATQYSLGTPIVTSALKFIALSGDGAYAATEIQAFGTPYSPDITSAVPEPETYAMLLAGLGLIGLVARRRHSDNALVAKL